MYITLDGEQLQVPEDTSMMNALATLSDKAYAKHHIVTSLTIGERRSAIAISLRRFQSTGS